MDSKEAAMIGANGKLVSTVAILDAEDVARIGAALYRGISYRGRPAWQSWLADGLGVVPQSVRRWLADGTSHVDVPQTTAGLLVAAERIADRLRMWEQPRGTLIVDRMAELAARQHTAL
jgi:hypothetical protein